MLSAGVAVAGGVKIIDYYRTIKGEHYECIEGTLVREHAGYGAVDAQLAQRKYPFQNAASGNQKERTGMFGVIISALNCGLHRSSGR